MKLLTLLISLLLTAQTFAQTNTLTDQEKSDGWSLLFDGKSLDGWTTVGDISAWTVAQDKDGPVITMKNPGHGEWLHTTKMYRDFELLVDFDVEKGKNSGVGLRGSSVGDPAFTGMEIQVFGNQGEKPTITSCGSVYDAIAPTAMPLKDGGQWNTFRITLIGDTINIWLNGEQIHKDQKLDTRGYVHKPEDKSPLNSRCPTGFIALQDHGDKVRFRNIKIKDLSPDMDPGGFEPLFDGKSTTGWTTKGLPGAGKWRVEDGVLVGSDVSLASEKSYPHDFEFRAFARCTPGADGAIGVLCANDPRNVLRVPDDQRWHLFRVRCITGQAIGWMDNEGQSVVGIPDGIERGPNATQPAPADVDRRPMLRSTRGDVMFKDVQVRTLGK